MNWFLQLAIGVCLIILCSGLVNWGNKYYSSRKRRDKKAKEEEDLIAKRLEQVEQRLTEVQDVMIALSEKIDYMDGMGAKPWSTKKADGKKS
ncbi:MAG: hypothetical protein F4Z85_10960 [Gemmatimonadetes bacterium]|nr:hypothetical protein [Gemmatimonadota bacterium]MYB70112.1 hypothetical protein [Gemmatimonadota bacterium]